MNSGFRLNYVQQRNPNEDIRKMKWIFSPKKKEEKKTLQIQELMIKNREKNFMSSFHLFEHIHIK